jgi:hypothetical protein
MYCDDAVQSWHFHAQVTHMDGCIEPVCKPSAEDGIVWVIEVYYVEGHVFCSCIFLASEGNWQEYFS